MTVFRFNIWFNNCEDKQVRFVLAETDEEAEVKLNQYREKMIADR